MAARCGSIGLCALALAGCQRKPESTIETKSQLTAIAPDVGAECRDLGGAVDGARACWSDACPRGVCRIERTLPAFAAATPMGFRCVGAREQRHCIDRSADAPRFTCDGPLCRQPHPRVPDNHEWTCSDAHGAALCLERAPAAGVIRGPLEPGFVCGQRSIAGTPSGERLCLDPSPDFPDGRAQNWSCHYEAEPRLTRVCRARPAPALGGSCSPPLGCPPGTRCIDGGCLPELPQPTCWLDADCKSGHCRFGSCVKER